MDINRRDMILMMLSQGLFGVSGAALVSRAQDVLDNAVHQESLAVIRLVADVILPRSETPSASDVDAHVFAMTAFLELKGPVFAARLVPAVSEFRTRFSALFGHAFETASDGERAEFVTRIVHQGEGEVAWFVRTLRKFVIIGWTLNREIAVKLLRYTPGPVGYRPATSDSRLLLLPNLDRIYL